MMRFEFGWNHGNFSTPRVLLTIGLVLSLFFLGNLILILAYPKALGAPTMEDLVAYFGNEKLFILEMLPFLLGLIGFFIAIKWIHKSDWKHWFTARAQVDVKRVVIAFFSWSLLIVIPTLIELLIYPDRYTWNFKAGPFFLTVLLLLVFLPFQVLFEELMFRSFIFQGLTKRTNSVWFAVGMSGIMFGLMHLGNPEVLAHGYWLLWIYITLGVALGFFTMMNQGLEVAFGFHLANNLITGLLVTSSDQAFQTNALLKMESLHVDIGSFLWLFVSLVVFYLFMARQFSWSPWREKANNE